MVQVSFRPQSVTFTCTGPILPSSENTVTRNSMMGVPVFGICFEADSSSAKIYKSNNTFPVKKLFGGNRIDYLQIHCKNHMYFFWFDHFAEHNFTENVFSEGKWAAVEELYGMYTIQVGINNQWLYLTDEDGLELLTTDIHAQEYVKLYFYAHTMAKHSHHLVGLPALEEDLKECDKKWGYPYTNYY